MIFLSVESSIFCNRLQKILFCAIMLSVIKNIFDVYFKKDVVAVFLFGMTSGIPAVLMIVVLATWMAEAGISNTTIGMFSFLFIPYGIKFLWAPVLENVQLPFFFRAYGMRRSWLIALQIIICVLIILLGAIDIVNHIYVAAVCVLIISFFSATQEAVSDAYRVELLKQNEQAVGSSSLIFGARISSLIFGGGLLIIIDNMPRYCNQESILCINNGYYNWFLGHVISSASLFFLAVIMMLLTVHDKNLHVAEAKSEEGIFVQVRRIFREPFLELIHRDKWYMTLLFVFLYRLCDSFIATMNNPFFLHVGFSVSEIGFVVKTFGVVASVIGGFLAGIICMRIGVAKSLWFFGIAQAVANLNFVIQNWVGDNLMMLYYLITCENIAGSLAAGVFIAYISIICDRRYIVTQVALLSSVAVLSRILITPLSGYLVDSVGWSWFYFISFLMGIPVLFMIKMYPKILFDKKYIGSST